MAWLLRFKPDEMPNGLFWILVILALLISVPLAGFGLWVVFTQIDFT
ncbi:hypothetical protein [Ferriphaselus sp. R-1]|nr:hypothetical protein [Ferriphaselus sp. R-1]